MSELHKQQCMVGSIASEKMSEEQIQKNLLQIPDWDLVGEDGLNKLKKTFRFEDFLNAMAFASRLTDLAEMEFHHPDLFIKWGSVTVTWWSHELKGLHKNDFILAARTNLLA